MKTTVTFTNQDLRDALTGYPAGVVLVAATHSGRPVGMLANSFTSVSLDPPLVSLAFAQSSTTWPLLRDVDRWGISVLAENQADHVRLLSRPTGVRFDGVVTEELHGGLVLVGSSLTLTVTRHAVVEAGDHDIALLRVLNLHRDPATPALVIHDRAPHRITHLAPPTPETQHHE